MCFVCVCVCTYVRTCLQQYNTYAINQDLLLPELDALTHTNTFTHTRTIVHTQTCLLVQLIITINSRDQQHTNVFIGH